MNGLNSAAGPVDGKAGRRLILVVTIPLWCGIACADGGQAASRAGANGAQEQGPPDACALLTESEIHEVLGQTPGEGVPDPIGDFAASCRWPSADGSEFQIAHVLLTLRGAVRTPTYESYLENAREQLGEFFSADDYRRVDDIGDYAVWYADALQVIKGETLFQVSVEGPDVVERSLALARKALERLP